MQSTTISHNTALSFSSLPFKISSGLLPKSPDESSPPPSWYQSRSFKEADDNMHSGINDLKAFQPGEASYGSSQLTPMSPYMKRKNKELHSSCIFEEQISYALLNEQQPKCSKRCEEKRYLQDNLHSILSFKKGNLKNTVKQQSHFEKFSNICFRHISEKDTKQNKSTELHILQEIREELANIIDFSHKRSTQYHEQNLLSSISKNDETLIEELKNKIDGSNEKKSLFGTFQPSSERGELDSLTSSSSSSSSSSISSRFCESVTTEDTNSSSDAVSSELSEPQRIIETISSWKPGTVKCVQLSNDVEVEVDGKRQSNCTETRRLLMENEWKREDAMLVNMNMSLPSVAASQKEGSEASEVSTSNREHENDCEGRTEHSQAGAEANNPTAFRQKVRKMHRELARHQVKDAKSYFKIFGLWVRKAWLTDEDEKRVWDEAERKLKIGVSEQGIVVNERKKDTLEELKGELEKAEAEAEAGGGRGEGEGEGEGEGGRGGEKKIGKEEIEELKMKILRKEKKIEKSRQFEGYSDIERMIIHLERDLEKKHQQSLACRQKQMETEDKMGEKESWIKHDDFNREMQHSLNASNFDGFHHSSALCSFYASDTASSLPTKNSDQKQSQVFSSTLPQNSLEASLYLPSFHSFPPFASTKMSFHSKIHENQQNSSIFPSSSAHRTVDESFATPLTAYEPYAPIQTGQLFPFHKSSQCKSQRLSLSTFHQRLNISESNLLSFPFSSSLAESNVLFEKETGSNTEKQNTHDGKQKISSYFSRDVEYESSNLSPSPVLLNALVPAPSLKVDNIISDAAEVLPRFYDSATQERKIRRYKKFGNDVHKLLSELNRPFDEVRNSENVVVGICPIFSFLKVKSKETHFV